MVTERIKHEELSSKWTGPDARRKKLIKPAKDNIGIEVKLRAQSLHTRDLNFGTRWTDVDIDALFFEILAKYNVIASIQPMLTDDETAILPGRLPKTYVLWIEGEAPPNAPRQNIVLDATQVDQGFNGYRHWR